MGYFKPHLPFNAPKRYWDLYKRDEIDLADNPFAPHNVPEIAMHNWGELRKYHGMPSEGPVPEEKARELIHGYYACTSYIDAQIGRLLDELDRLGLRENTVVVVWGDHGWQLGEHGLWCKHSNFETSAHAPLIFSAPGMKDAGKPTDALVEFVDIYPTLCELAGLPLPDHLEGTSLVPVLNDAGRKWKSAAFSQYPRYVMGYSMRTDRYRFTLWMKNDGQAEAIELYDHRVDPSENNNIAGSPENTELVKQLTKQLKSGWRGALPG